MVDPAVAVLTSHQTVDRDISAYERWLRKQCRVVESNLEAKHELMLDREAPDEPQYPEGLGRTESSAFQDASNALSAGADDSRS